MAGDEHAFESIYRANAARVFGVCLRMSGTRERASELTQDVFVRGCAPIVLKLDGRQPNATDGLAAFCEILGAPLLRAAADPAVLVPSIRSALRALDRLRMRPLLDGFRGGPPAQIDRLVDVVVRFSELVIDAAETIGGIDVNPVIAGPERAVAVDALMTPA